MNIGHIAFKRNRTLTFYYTLLLLSLFLLFGVVIHSSIVIQKEKKDVIAEYTNQSADTLDKEIQNTLYDYMESNLDRFMRQSTFSLFFERESTFDLDFFTRMRLSMVDNLRFHADIKDVTLYRSSDNSVLSAKNSSFTLNEINSNYDYLLSILNMALPSSPDFITPPGGDTYYYYPINAEAADENGTPTVGFAIASLQSPTDFFTTNIHDLNPKGTFLVLNNEYPLSIEGYNILSTEIILKNIEKHPSGTIFHSTRIDTSSPYTFYYIPSKVSNLTYVYYEPLVPTFFNLTAIAEKGIIYPVIIAILCIVLFFCITISIIKKYQEAAKISIKQTPIYSISDLSSICATIQDSFSATSLPYYSVLLIQYHLKDDSFDNGILKGKIKNAAQNYLTVCKLLNTVIIQQDSIYCLINFNDYNLNVLTKSLVQVLYKTIDSCDFNLYYVSPTSDIGTLEDDLKLVENQLRYTTILGYGKNISSDYLKICEGNCENVDSFSIVNLKNMLAEKKYNEFTIYVQEIKDKIKNGTYSYRSVNDFMEIVFFTIKTYFIDKLYRSPLTKQTIVDVRETYIGIESFLDFLLSCLESYKQALECATTDSRKHYMDAIYEYVEKNLSSVTLNSMAEHFQVTPAHLSRLFKKNADINFSEYISEKKLQAAISLLESDEKLSINEISKILGYNTPAYFLTKFKERFGITPSSYRKNHFTNTSKQLNA